MALPKQLADFAKHQPKHSRCLMTRRLEEQNERNNSTRGSFSFGTKRTFY
jgi:hypothetical protein